MSSLNYICVVGSRSLPSSWYCRVKSIVSYLIKAGYGIGTGGAIGADLFAIKALVHYKKCVLSSVYLPSLVSCVPRAVRSWLVLFIKNGGNVIEGAASPSACHSCYISALFARSRALVSGSSGVVAFICGPSKGTWFTCKYAVSLNKKVVVFPVSAGSSGLMVLGAGHWAPLSGLFAGGYQWVPNPTGYCKHGITFEYCAYCNKR